MKVAPVYRALATRDGVQQTLLHTGQHYDFNMSDIFFQQLEMPVPDVNLAVGSGSHARQTAEIMARFEGALLERQPDLVLVYGDVNSTIAASLVCAKLQVKLGHVEAGLRAFDRSMPEEINRVLTDQLADLLFTPSQDANENLAHEGIPAEKMFLVGNVMIDSLIRFLPRALDLPVNPQPYALLTLHRPANVDDPVRLKSILEAIREASGTLEVVFPVHPRTRQKLAGVNGNWRDRLKLLDPLPYIEFLALQHGARVVLTDSGGIQEETTYLGVPCLTLRGNTERPITVIVGTNTIMGSDLERLRGEISDIASGKGKRGAIPPLWDGHAGERIADIVAHASHDQFFNHTKPDRAAVQSCAFS